MPYGNGKAGASACLGLLGGRDDARGWTDGRHWQRSLRVEQGEREGRVGTSPFAQHAGRAGRRPARPRRPGRTKSAKQRQVGQRVAGERVRIAPVAVREGGRDDGPALPAASLPRRAGRFTGRSAPSPCSTSSTVSGWSVRRQAGRSAGGRRRPSAAPGRPLRDARHGPGDEGRA